MEVADGLAAVGAGVEYHAIAAFGDVAFSRYITAGEEEFSEEGAVAVGGGTDAVEVAAGDDEDVNWGLGVQIVEGEDVLRLQDGGSGDFAGGDFAEDAAHGFNPFLGWWVSGKSPREDGRTEFR